VEFQTKEKSIKVSQFKVGDYQPFHDSNSSQIYMQSSKTVKPLVKLWTTWAWINLSATLTDACFVTFDLFLLLSAILRLTGNKLYKQITFVLFLTPYIALFLVVYKSKSHRPLVCFFKYKLVPETCWSKANETLLKD